jgi:YD repeat-containing protein
MVTDQDGTVRTYSYDLLYQLTEERVTDGSGALLYQNTFSYDLIGNRVQLARTAADGSIESIVYSYDEHGRLLSEVSALRNIVYGWDANGNRTSRSGTGAAGSDVGMTYAWDDDGRLVG